MSRHSPKEIERCKRVASKMTVDPAGAKAHSLHRIVKLPDSKFTNANCSETNRVFLWKNYDSPPYIRPVEGWEIIGYGKAPWPGNSNGFAVMLEKKTPAEEKNNIFAPDHIRFDEGTRIWAHLNERHFRELNNQAHLPPPSQTHK